MKLYVIVDAQNDFCHEDGALPCFDINRAMKNLEIKLNKLATNYENGDRSFIVLLTADQHGSKEEYLKTLEGKNLCIPHCERGSWGADFHPIVNNFAEQILSHCPIIENEDTWKYSPIYAIDKEIFGTNSIFSFFAGLNSVGASIDEIEIMGFAADICVISNAVIIQTATEHKIPISINMSCSAGSLDGRFQSVEEVFKALQMNPFYEEGEK